MYNNYIGTVCVKIGPYLKYLIVNDIIKLILNKYTIAVYDYIVVQEKHWIP